MLFSSWGARGLVLALAACASASPPPTPRDPPTAAVPQDLFARVNGVTLHYLDWGGKGDLLLFLPGLSHTAHVYDGIAPTFTDRYRAMALTRRAHGASEKPSSGYDLETLVQDVIGFLDAVHADRVVLVGHSFGGLELPLVAAREPKRVVGLIFLDAVYDWPALLNGGRSDSVNRYYVPPDSAMASREALDDWYRRRDPKSWGPAQAATLRSQTYLGADGRLAWQLPADIEAQLLKTAAKGADFSGIRVPTLAIWANQTKSLVEGMQSFGYPASAVELGRKWATEVDVKVKQSGVEALKRSAPNATIVEMEAPHVLYWYNPTGVIQLMNRFLDRSSSAK